MVNRERATKTGRSGSSTLVEGEYVDEEGRHWAVLMPEGHENPEMGILLGPPDLESLELPLDVEVRLHNQLFNRRLYTLRDVRRDPDGIKASIQAAYRLDFQRVTGLYHDK